MDRGIFQRLEIGLYSISSTRDNCAVAQRAEERGFRRIWLAENHHSRDLMVQAAAVAGVTQSIEIALGIVTPYSRHPAQIAMGVADLEELAGPRFVLGLGAAWNVIKTHGLEDPRPITGLREAGEICRRLLRGERVVYEGKIFRLPAPGVQIAFPLARQGVPLYFGTLGPRTLRMAASMADGILFSVFCSPAFVETRMEDIRAGAAAAGRAVEEMDVACYIIFSVDEDGDAARRAAKDLVAHYLLKVPDTVRFAHAGLDVDRIVALQEELRKAEGEGRRADAVAALPDDVVQALAVAGTPEECVEGLRAYAAVGIKTPVLYHVLGEDRVAAVDLIADRVAPELVGESS
ncbi:MAG: LLM class flavin-dependent oxidoreductase [bacterium]